MALAPVPHAYTMLGAWFVWDETLQCRGTERKNKKRWHAPGRKPLGITRTQLPAPTKCSSGTGHCCSTYIVCMFMHVHVSTYARVRVCLCGHRVMSVSLFAQV